jgi:hypothetical protein
MTLEESGISSAGVIVQSMNSVALLALYNALLILGSWSSYMKTP